MSGVLQKSQLFISVLTKSYNDINIFKNMYINNIKITEMGAIIHQSNNIYEYEKVYPIY